MHASSACFRIAMLYRNKYTYTYRIHWGALADNDMTKIFPEIVSSMFRKLSECTMDAEVEWHLLKAAVVSPDFQVCGRKRLGVANNSKKVTHGGL